MNWLPGRDSHPMHIIQMVNALRVGGAEKLIVTFAQAVQQKNVQLTVVTLRPNLPEIQEQVESTGARVVTFNHRKIQAPNRFIKLVKFIHHERPAVIHTHLTMATILGAASGILTGVPVVTSLHNTTMQTSKKPLLSSLETFMLRIAVRRVIAVGWQTAEAHQIRLKSQAITVIPNAVPIPKEFSDEDRISARRALTGDPRRAILLSVSRLEPQKGVMDLIESFRLIHEVYPEAALVLVGTGSLENQVRDRIKSLGMTQSVRLLGLRHDIPKLLAASDIFVSAAHWEGLPVASLEAMAAGLPLVVTNVGDLPRVITPGTGFLVPPKDPAALADRVNLLLNQPQLRRKIGQAARKHIADCYNADDWSDRILEVYASTTQGTR